MKEYFVLQCKMTFRKLAEFHIHPAIGLSVLVFGFAFFVEYLFLKTKHANYLLLFLALSILFKIANKNRIEFLKLVFGDRKSSFIRIIENIAISIPFLIALLFHKSFFIALILLLLCPLFIFIKTNFNTNFTLPTPFYKKPFEFPVGFRKYILLILCAIALTFISIYVNNFNLGIFSIWGIFIIFSLFYIEPEEDFYLWIFAFTPSKFLFEKLKIGFLFSSILTVPMLTILIVFFQDQQFNIIFSTLIGLFVLCTFILAKYSAYPNEIHIAQIVPIGLCVFFPPLLIALIPFFYFKAKNNLKSILK